MTFYGSRLASVAALPRGSVPHDLLEFWLACRTARLFEDVEYGQWGLRLLSPSDCARRTEVEFQRRPRDGRDQDLVIGEFLGVGASGHPGAFSW